MGNEQSQQEGSEGMASRGGTGAPAGVTPPPPSNDMAPNRTGVEDENVGVAPPPGVDLSNLSEEERKMILSVMARAQDLDNDITQRRRSAELSRAESLPNSVTAHQVVCLACHVTELTDKTSAKCTKCGKTVCEKCGQHPTSADGKKYPWICNACARHHIQASRTRAKGQVIRTNQDDVARVDSAENDSSDKNIQRKEDVPIRRQTRPTAKSRRESVEVVITDDKQQHEARIKGSHKRNDGIVRASRPPAVVNGEMAAPQKTTAKEDGGSDATRSELTAQTRKAAQAEVKPRKIPESKPTEAVTKPVQSPKKFEATSSPKVSKKAEVASTPQKAELAISPKKKDFMGSPKKSDGSPKRVEVAASGQLKSEVVLSPKKAEPTISPQRAEPPPSPKRTETAKPQAIAPAVKTKPVAQTAPSELPSSPQKKASEVLPKPVERPPISNDDKDLSTSRTIVPISTSQTTITSPVYDRPIISVDVVIVSKCSASFTTLHDASKSDTTDTMATLSTLTTTTKSKTGGSTRSSVVSIMPSQSVLGSVSPTAEDSATVNKVSEEFTLSKDSAVFALVKKADDSSINSMQSIRNKIADNWEQNNLNQINESGVVDTRGQLAKELVKPVDSSIKTTEIRSDLPSREEVSSTDVTPSYEDQSEANYQTKESNQSKQKPKTIDLQLQKKVKQKVETADWSPVSDLSPIPDVSPSLEAAEREIMEQFRGRSDSEGSNNLTSTSPAIPRATSGTISGMLADFNKALGLLDTSPIEDPQKQDKSVVSPSQSPQEVPATCSTLVSVTTEPSTYHPVRQQRSQQQPGTPRRTRRLPQPTMEQMQAAVAMAAHGPRDKQSIALTPVTTSLPVTTSQRPVSPIIPWRTIDSYLMSDVDDYDARSLIQPTVGLQEDINATRAVEDSPTSSAPDTAALAEPTTTAAEQSKLGTEEADDRTAETISTPVSQVDSELSQLSSLEKEDDGTTDLDLIKLKLRRKLPSVPSPDYGKLPCPNKRAKDRARTLSTGATPLYTQELSSGEEPIADDSSSVTLNSQKRSESADGDYVRNLSPTRSNVSYSPEAGHGLGSRKELSVSQGNLPYLRTPSPLLGSDNRQLVGAGTNLPAYMKTLKQQLREELKAVTEERKRVQEVRSKERDYYMSPEKESNYVSQQWQETDASLQYDNLAHRSLLHSTPPTSTVRRQSSPHTSPRKGRRRHTSDVALRPFSPIKEDRNTEETKSAKIAPADEEKHPKEPDVIVNKDSTGKEIEHYFQQYSGELAKQAKEMKRVTIAQKETEGSTIESTSFSRLRVKNGSNMVSTTPPSSSDSWMKSSNSYCLTTERKKQRKEKKSRKPRSWHPSPYVSEDEDEQMTREEKKAKIKAEIARRRQQIEENARLHEELMKLAKSRENAEQMEYKTNYEYKSTPSISEHTTMYRTSLAHTTPSTRSTDSSMLPGDTTSVLQAIDEILRKETQGVSSVRSTQYYNPAPPPSMYSTMPRSRYTPRDTSWYQREPSPTTMQFPDTTAEDESIARIASTFPAENTPKTGLLITKPKPLLELETPPENDLTPPMPLLPDMPSRSRKLLEDLGSSPIGGQPGRVEAAQPQYRQCSENERVPHVDVEPLPEPTMMRQMRKVQRPIIVRTPQKYEFPIKRILLTRDPKDRSVSGNGLGMKVVGGKEIPGGNGLLGAYVAKVCPGGVVETMGEVREGNQVLEWNGVPLTGRTYEEVQKIISVQADEVEIVIRSDFNMLEPISSCQGLSPARDGASPCSTPSDSLKVGTPGVRTPSPCPSLTARRVSSPASTSSSISTPTYDNIAPSHLGSVDKVQAVPREHYRRNTVQTIPRFIGNHYGSPPQPTIERRES